MSFSKLMYKVLITPTVSFGKFSIGYERLRQAGCEPIKSPYQHPLKEKELMETIRGIDGLIIGADKVTAEVISRADRLKVISKHGVGLDNVDVEKATSRGIVVANGPGTNDDAVADLTFGLILSLARKIPQADRGVKEGKWEKIIGVGLKGKTLGIIGAGRIGKKVIKRASGFDMKVLVYDIYQDAKLAKELDFEYVSLQRLLQESDFVSLHVPFTENTKGMIGEEEIKSMKNSAYFINTARGGVIDEKALIKALKERKIAGAAVDAFSQEPPITNPLLKLDNIITTPHMGADTKEAIRNMDLVSVENVIRVLKGKDPVASVNFHLVKNKMRSVKP